MPNRVGRAWRVVADNYWPLDDAYTFRNPRAIPSVLRIDPKKCEFHSTGQKYEGDWLFYITWKTDGDTIAMYTLKSVKG